MGEDWYVWKIAEVNGLKVDGVYISTVFSFVDFNDLQRRRNKYMQRLVFAESFK